jgi:serine/threonine protein kinase
MKQSNQPTCPKCAAAIPDEAPGGLCPQCALEGVATAAKTMSGGRKSAPPRIAEIAPHFPELEILELIGAGGMGAVYKARQPQLDRFVALKILSHDLAGDPTFVERFNREARVLARLSHPNIVGIHDFGTAGPYCFLTMELVDGVNLRQAMQAGRFAPTESLAMVQHLCSALAYAHAEGILHRDIKPENILIDAKGRVKIADFGIAKLVGEDREQDFTLTLQGSVLGSPHYMAPEQIETPGDVDQRADIYSLGVVLYEMLTGGLPLGRFALPSEKAVMDARIDHIVMRTLEKERDARYQSAGEVGTEVEALGKSPAPPAIKAAALPAEPVAARFSLLAAILTGVSFPLVILAFGLDGPRDLKGIIAIAKILFVVFSGICAVTGFILGARAMGEIRRSLGVKTGLGSAIFATTAWPILILIWLSMGAMVIPMLYVGRESSGGVGIGFAWLVSLVTGLSAACVLVRALSRWAKGVENTDGNRIHPRLGRPLLVVIAVAVLVPALLTEIAVRIFPGSPETRVSAETRMEESMKREEEKSGKEGNVKRMDAVDWKNALPEVEFNIVTHANRKVEFQLIRTNHSSNDPFSPRHTLQTFYIRGTSNDYGGTDVDKLFIGTAYGVKHSLSLAAVIQGYETKDSVLDMDFQGWQFEKELPSDLYFAEEGTTEYLIATKDKDKPEIAEQLALRVEVTAMRK